MRLMQTNYNPAFRSFSEDGVTDQTARWALMIINYRSGDSALSVMLANKIGDHIFFLAREGSQSKARSAAGDHDD